MTDGVSVATVGGLPAPVLPWVLAGLLIGALAGFLRALWPKWSLLRRAAPDPRFDRPGARLLQTLKIALGQSKMFQDPVPGWMHALIFWGFLVLLLRALQFFLMGFRPALAWGPPLAPGWTQAYYGVKDLFVVLVTLACLYALYRRLVLRPKRLTLSGEGLLILGLILLIMASDVVFEGALQTLAPDSVTRSAFLGHALAGVLAGWPVPLREGALAAGWWVHVLAILGFINLLPRSKHFHIITSLPNVFFSRAGEPGQGLRRLDFESENTEQFGITRIEELSWKHLLDLHTCTECGRCDVFCPALNSGKPLSPKQFTVDLRDHLNAVTPSLLAVPPEGMEAVERPALMGQTIADETVWSCTTCGACEQECPVMIEYVNKMIDLRRGLVMMEDRYPKEAAQAFRSLDTHSNPWGFPSDTRADWASHLEVPLWDRNRPTEYLYFVGCNGAFDRRGKAISQAVARLLLQAGVSFSILGNREGCTGDPARRLGNEYLFDVLAQQNAQTFREERVRKIITHCPHCFNSLKNEYPEFGVTLEVIHHSQLLAHLVAEGRIAAGAAAPAETVIHDSCYLGRHNGEYEAPREVLSSKGAAPREVPASRERGTCCGAGGGRFLLEETTGTRMSHNRIEELMAADPETIAVSCPFCVLMLEDGLKARGLAGRVQVRDIAEILDSKAPPTAP